MLAEETNGYLLRLGKDCLSVLGRATSKLGDPLLALKIEIGVNCSRYARSLNVHRDRVGIPAYHLKIIAIANRFVNFHGFELLCLAAHDRVLDCQLNLRVRNLVFSLAVLLSCSETFTW